MLHPCVYSVMSDSLQPHGLKPGRLFCSCDFPGNNTAVGCHFLFKGNFLIQGSNTPPPQPNPTPPQPQPGPLHWQAGSLMLGHLGSPIKISTPSPHCRHPKFIWYSMSSIQFKIIAIKISK